MSDDRRPHLAPRARPVADLRVESISALSQELAREWAIALITARPLQDIGGIPLEELAREGPALCAQMLRAVQSDVELERLTGSGGANARERLQSVRSLAAMTGARDAAGLVDGVEALRGVLWEALLEEPPEAMSGRALARWLGELGDRLGHVCSSVLVAAIGAAPPPAGGDVGDGEAIPESARSATQDAPRERHVVGGAVIVDELAGAPSTTPRVGPAVAVAAQSEARPQSWDVSPPLLPGVAAPRQRSLSRDESPPRGSDAPRVEIEIRDERGEEGSAAWIGSIGGQLERFERDRVPFAVLLVEPTGIERMHELEAPAELVRLTDRLEQALMAELVLLVPGAAGARVTGATLTREGPGRYWLLVPETDRAEAYRLGERLMTAVASALRYRGAALELAIGTAACPEDGDTAPALAAHADVGLYAARAAARARRGCPAAAIDDRL